MSDYHINIFYRYDVRAGGTMSRLFDELSTDPVIEAYKKDLDLTLIRENLKRTPEERIRNLMELQRFAEELQRAGREAWSKR